MEWTQETYRLDKVSGIFGLPCVVRLEEGYLPPDEAGEFAKGDIISLDTEIPSDKIGAYFMHVDAQRQDNNILTIDNQEVFLPFSYNGKLRVLKKIAKVDTVQELAEIFPGYAELEGKLSFKSSKGDSFTLYKGTIIKLDRIIPGCADGSKRTQDKLIIRFKHLMEEKTAAIPYDMKGQFLTKRDIKKYTIRDAVERYGLPLDVTFINDEITQKFHQEVLAGRRRLASVTATLRLSRIVKQRVIVGHYKPILDIDYIDDSNLRQKSNIKNDRDEAIGGKKDIRTRTVVVIPIENPAIGEIPVNVCEDDILTKYTSLVDLQSVSEAQDMAKESLCLDFEVQQEMKLLAKVENKAINENKNLKNKQPKPHLHLPVDQERQFSERMNLTGASTKDVRQGKPPMHDESETEDDGRLEPLTIRTIGKLRQKEKEQKEHLLKIKNGNNDSKTNVAEYKQTPPATSTSYSRISVTQFGSDSTDDIEIYMDMCAGDCMAVDDKPKSKNSLFQDLTCEELVDRLYICNLYEIAKICKEEKLDGAYFTNETHVSLKETCGLKGIKLAKFLKMRDENWVSKFMEDDKPKNVNIRFQDLTCEELVHRLYVCNLHETAKICREENLDGDFFTNESHESLKEIFKLKGIKLAKFLKMKDENWFSK